MKLLLFIHSLSNGGAERVTSNLANHWAAQGLDITMVTIAPRSLDFYELHPLVKRVALDLAGDSSSPLAGLRQNLRRLFALRRVLSQVKPDVAISMMSNANVLLALAAWRMPRLCVIGAERTFPPQLPLGRLWEFLRRYTYGLLGAVVALTRESATWLEAHTNVRRVAVIPNAVPWPMPEQTPRIEPFAVCAAGRKLMLAVGRLSEEKNCDVLLDVFSRLAGNHPDWDLVFVGDGSERASLEARVRAAGLEGRVFLPGRAGNVGAWYERADIYVLTSRYEGFPNSLAEAMAHGLAVVSFDCDTGPRDIIRHGVDGLLVPPGNVVALAAALERLMGDEFLRKQYAERAVETRDRFSMKRIAGMWEELFADLLP